VKSSHDWPAAAEPPALELGEIHLWRVKVPDEGNVPTDWLGFLTAEERDRVARKRIPVDARRTLTSRACLRLLLGMYVGLPPEQIALEATPEGKPILRGQGEPDRIEFNVSHSAEWVMLGFSRGPALGLDVECHRELEFDNLVTGFFSPIERKAWASLPLTNRCEAFFAAWTRKEAYLKALGVGLAKSLDSFSVTLEAGSSGNLVWCADHPRAPQTWRFVSNDPAPGYAGALALDYSSKTLRTFSFHAPEGWSF